MDVEDKGLFACAGSLLFMAVLLVGGTLYSGWVISILWGWFIVPVFHAVQITTIQAIGIAIVKGALFTVEPRQTDTEREIIEIYIRAFVYAFGVPTLMLFFGWIANHFM